MSNDKEITRRLKAILSADVKGYSLLMADDELFTIRTLKEYRQIIADTIQRHSGRVVDSPGDNILAEFGSAVDAVECAVQVQRKLKKENVKFVESVMREIDFSDDALGFAELADVGPGGKFIDRYHTVSHFRKELWFPGLLDREYYDAWLEGGAVSMAARCRQRKEEILAAHEPEPVSKELEQALDDIVDAAKSELLEN